MAGLVRHKDYSDWVVNICYNDTEGEIVVYDGLLIQLPKKPRKEHILFHNLQKEKQYWRRLDLPKELMRVRSMDEWYEMPQEFRDKYTPYITEEFKRRREGIWFYNNGEPTYITGDHYMFLQWSKIDIGYPSFYHFQRKIEIHWEACVVDPRCLGQLYTKCRRSGFTNLVSGSLVSDATIAKEKLVGIQSKTGKDAQENVFTKKVIPIYLSYPFFFKPIQDGTSNPKAELAFREPSKRITKKNKTSHKGEALNTIVNWKNTTNGAYDGEKLFRFFIDEAYKVEKPANLLEMWRIQKTCLFVGRNVIGKARVGSTVNPLDKGGAEGVKLIGMSITTERDANGQTKSGLYHLFIPAYEALEGFFDMYGNCVETDPTKPINGIDGNPIEIGSKTFMKNKRKSLTNDAKELNEYVRQFPFTLEEACRDSTEGSLFNIGKIYQQIEHNNELIVDPVVRGNFYWVNGTQDGVVAWSPDPNGKFYVTWMPKPSDSNKKTIRNGLITPLNAHVGVGGVDSYDIDKTVDSRSSKGAALFYNKAHMDGDAPTNMFVLEYADRPPKATMFYEDILMAAVYYGYPLLIENNKRRIIQYFQERGYVNYVMKRPDFLKPRNSRYVFDDYGVPSNSEDVIDQHAQAIEAYVEDHVGFNTDTAKNGKMYFNRTLAELIRFDINDRTEFDLTIAMGYALLGAQRKVVMQKTESNDNRKFFRKFKPNA
jgi:hypothetical protein